jgi:hypothetical protein
MSLPHHSELVIRLLVQDMKHEQLLDALNKLGFETDRHTLDLFNIIAELMGIAENQASWAWSDIYMEYMNKALLYPVTLDGESLVPLAKECYEKLVKCMEQER